MCEPLPARLCIMLDLIEGLLVEDRMFSLQHLLFPDLSFHWCYAVWSVRTAHGR